MGTGEVATREDQLWPFGKYQGQPVDRVMADHSYLEWVLNQPWFAEDYSRLHGLIINFGNESQDSPEHNAFQIRFLDEEVRLAVARRLGFEELDGAVCGKQKAVARRIGKELGCVVHEKESQLRVSAVKFEESGWDVAFDILPASYVAWLDAARGKDYVELLEGWGKPKLAESNRGKLKAHHGTLDVAVYEPNSFRRPRVLVELKPDLGDDYPSVLRQIQRYPGGENESFAETGRVRRSSGRGAQGSRGSKAGAPRELKVLIVRRARFSTVSFEQVKAFFASANVLFILESELDVRDDPNVVDAEVIEDGSGVAGKPLELEATSTSGASATASRVSRSNRGTGSVVDPDAERFDRPSERSGSVDRERPSKLHPVESQAGSDPVDELLDAEFLAADLELRATEAPLGAPGFVRRATTDLPSDQEVEDFFEDDDLFD